MREWMSVMGSILLILIGVVLYSVDSDFPTAGTLTLVLPLILVDLVWRALDLRRQLASPQGSRGRGGRLPVALDVPVLAGVARFGPVFLRRRTAAA